jgi:hypothetical protein
VGGEREAARERPDSTLHTHGRRPLVLVRTAPREQTERDLYATPGPYFTGPMTRWRGRPVATRTGACSRFVRAKSQRTYSPASPKNPHTLPTRWRGRKTRNARNPNDSERFKW